MKSFTGYCSGVEPPLPIPNREVKRSSAESTAVCGRIGRGQVKGHLRVAFYFDLFYEIYYITI